MLATSILKLKGNLDAMESIQTQTPTHISKTATYLVNVYMATYLMNVYILWVCG